MVVELQGDADDVIALALEQRGGHRAVDAAGHGDDDSLVAKIGPELKITVHGARI